MGRNAPAVLEAEGRISREVGRGTFLRPAPVRGRPAPGGQLDAHDGRGRDFALHHAIVAARRNQLVRTMCRVIGQARQGEMWGTLKRRNDSRERRAAYQAEHVELVEAICACQLHRSTDVMEAHLGRVQANLLGSSSAAED